MYKERMEEEWKEISYAINEESELSLKEVWQRGYARGYFAGLDRGMELEHESARQWEEEAGRLTGILQLEYCWDGMGYDDL